MSVDYKETRVIHFVHVAVNYQSAHLTERNMSAHTLTSAYS